MTLIISLAVGLVLAAIYASLRYTWWWPSWPKGVPSFIMLHSVSDGIADPEAPNNSIHPAALREVIRILKSKGYVFQTFSAAVATPAERSAVLTLDDGFVDNYTDLFPILKSENVKATLFVTNRGIDDDRFLSAAQILEMDRSGLVEIGGHTAHHTFLKQVSLETARKEIESNKRWLEEVVGHPIMAFCYPKGEETDEIVELVKNAGYLSAAAMVKGMRPPATDVYRVHRQILPRGLSPHRCALLAMGGKHKI